MTKKSIGRQKRDAEIKDARCEIAEQIKGNKIYDDIGEVYQSCAHVLGGYGHAFNQLNIGAAVPLFTPEQNVKVETLITGFKEDMGQLTNDLLRINAPFKGKTGGEDNVDRFTETVGVVDQFTEFCGRAKGVLDPNFRSLAAEVCSVLKPLTPEQDPNTVTDVEVKNVATQ